LFTGGAPVQRPPTITRPVMVGSGAPLITKHVPPPPSAVPAPASRGARAQVQGTPVSPRAARPADQRPIITRTPPPQQAASPEARGRAMEAHPGRPLEPQQQQALRAGRPAGPPHDSEVPAHPAPAAGRSGNPPRPLDKKPGRA
jgi:hypothetical protein